MFTKLKDTTDILDKNNAIYMFSCRDCDKLYNEETSKKINTRLTKHKNAIGRHDSRSLPATHADDTGHNIVLTKTSILGQGSTRHAREFKEAWHSIGKTISNYISNYTTH